MQIARKWAGLFYPVLAPLEPMRILHFFWVLGNAVFEITDGVNPNTETHPFTPNSLNLVVTRYATLGPLVSLYGV